MYRQNPRNGTKIPFESYSEGRRNHLYYSTFVRTFVKQVVGIHKWEERLNNARLHPDTFFTASDEAFALVVLFNYHNYWTEIFVKNGHQVPMRKCKRDIDDDDEVLDIQMKPVFTDGNLLYHKEDNKITKGWSNEGLQKFNDFYQKCEEDRKKFPDFNRKFLEEEREESKKSKKYSRKKKQKTGPIIDPSRGCFFALEYDNILVPQDIEVETPGDDNYDGLESTSGSENSESENDD